ncbi:hypothetical protein AVEN_139134-1 [Araneus ventricosus]|uniref:Uncharacterized protein n=1 Tax=Araneus ventricosus TaxID=182803 RepID=A0A4Y2K993_ARAVE|nr:hypothetical protein AVEN_139134-1 [Araneus ventricosus]
MIFLLGDRCRSTCEVNISELMPKLRKSSGRGSLDANFFYGGFDTLVYRGNKCFGSHSDYVERQYVPAPDYLVYIFELLNESFLSEGLLSYFLNCLRIR